jgi:AmiR/NasT family two-component response regulator
VSRPPTYAKKTDLFHGRIKAALSQAGYYVVDTSHTGNGFPDLLVCGRQHDDQVMLMEIKTPGEGLNENEIIFHLNYPGPICIVYSEQEAVDQMQEFDA